MKNFNDATNILSGIYYPTSNIFLLTYLDIVGVLADPNDDDFDDTIDLTECIKSMRQKWIYYYKYILLFYLVAFVLDPRFKIEDLENVLQNYYKLLNDSSIIVSSIVDNVRRTLIELYNDYVSRYNIRIDDTTQSIESIEQSKLPASRSWLMQRSKKCKSTSTTITISEINAYLTTNFEFP